MSRLANTGRVRQSTVRLALGAVLALVTASVVLASPAVAQTTEVAGRSPILTVTDATIERCGPVTITGTDFVPDTSVSVAVNGTTEEKRPDTDASGTFTFTTEVECEQSSGFLKIQATDGTTTVPIDITISEVPTPIPQGPLAEAPKSIATGDLALWLVRFVLAAILVAELVLLNQRQRRRRARRARQESAAA